MSGPPAHHVDEEARRGGMGPSDADSGVRRRRRWIPTAGLTSLSLIVAAGLTACGGGDQQEAPPADSASASAAHIHGLGINPGDGALFIATHSGLFRSSEGTDQYERVGDTAQDTMGFTITGPDQFLGSGHPAPDQGGPPNLGLIRSTDAGASWAQVSLAGEADFHVLRSSGERVYGYNGLSGRLMVSEDGGVNWESREPPAAIIDVAIDPDDPDRLLAATERGIALSEDGAGTWKPLSADIGLLAWPSEGRVYLVDAAGTVKLGDGEGSWTAVGQIGGQPVALAATAPDQAFAALADGSVLESNDGGSSWGLRVDLAQPLG